MCVCVCVCVCVYVCVWFVSYQKLKNNLNVLPPVFLYILKSVERRVLEFGYIVWWDLLTVMWPSVQKQTTRSPSNICSAGNIFISIHILSLSLSLSLSLYIYIYIYSVFFTKFFLYIVELIRSSNRWTFFFMFLFKILPTECRNLALWQENLVLNMKKIKITVDR